MRKIGTVNKTKEILEANGFFMKKKFGQNFLIDQNILSSIVSKSEINKNVNVIEIGPGIGCLTQELAVRYRKVVAVEIDRGLIPILEKTMAEYDNVTVINEDIMKVDLRELVEKYSEGRPVSVCANLPYYITTPILMYLLESGVKFNSITVMIQNEVASRLVAKAGSSDYGAITAVLGYYGTVRKLFKVSAGCFTPAPKVDSAVVRIDLYKEPFFKPKNEKLFRNLIKFAFEMRRKTLVNAISAKLPYSKEVIVEALAKMGLPETIRGERLSTEEFVALSDLLA